MQKYFRLLHWMAVPTLLALASASACAQRSDRASTDTPEPVVVEEVITQAPEFNMQRLIGFKPLGGNETQQWGIDPQTITISKQDGIIRYVVVVQTSTGLINAMYEGISCQKAEHKTYARYLSSQGRWTMLVDPPWVSLRDVQSIRYALSLARMGLCDGVVAAISPRQAAQAIARGGTQTQ